VIGDGAGLGDYLAAEERAETAQQAPRALAPRNAAIRLRQYRGGLRERMVAEALGGVGEHVGGLAPHQRWQGVLPGTRGLERVPSRLQPTAEVAGAPGDADVVLHARVVRLELLVGERPVLHGAPLGDHVLAVTGHVVAAIAHVAGVEAPRLRRPV